MSGLPRYDHEADGMVRALDGYWITMDDHRHEVARLTAELDAARATLRDQAAFAALTGINANPAWNDEGWEIHATAAYDCADAMLAARAKGGAE